MSGQHITEDTLRLFLYGKKSSTTTTPDWRLSMHGRQNFLPAPRQVVIGTSGLPGCSSGVYAVSWIRSGTEMGPFVGNVLRLDNINYCSQNENVWEVFDSFGNIVYYVDGGSDQSPASWLTCVQCARNEEEQNLGVIQIGRDIYYRATKDIAPEQELLVWYGPSNCLYMGIPFTILHDQATEKQQEANPIQQIQSSEVQSVSKLKCVLCRRGFNSRSNLRSHMRIHTMEKPFSCRFCSRRFSQSSTLRNHVRLHTGERPYKCLVCKSSYSQLAGLRAHQRSARHKLSSSPQS